MDTSEASWKQKQIHSSFKNMLKMMNECNIIKFAGYRTAAKLRVLQRVLHMDIVRLGVIAGVFNRHHLQVTENGVLLKYTELEAVLFDIFFAAQKESSSQIDVELSTDLMIHFLQNVYDRKANGAVQVLCVKVALVVLSSAQLQEKYEYLFKQLADHNSCISSNKFEKLLTSLIHISVYLNESTAFGFEHIPGAVDSCFQQAQGTLGITEDMFIGWLLREPQILMWLPTLHRMQMAEMVSHSVKCSLCKLYPIIGLRYRCLECLRYNLCQTCFFTGKSSKRHKLQHPVQEYSYETSSRETFAFLKMLKNKLCGSSCQLQYLSIQPHDVAFETDSVSEENVILLPSSEENSNFPTVIHESLKAHPQTELQSIISRLEEENKCLRQMVNRLNEKEEMSDMCKQLREHQIFIATQVERLKKLRLNCSRVNLRESRHPLHLQSTPLNRNSETSSLSNLSPILKEDEMNKLSAGLQELQLLTWQLKQDRQKSDNGEVQAADGSSLTDISLRDLSTWVANRTAGKAPDPSGFSTWAKDPGSTHRLEELDSILEKLQGIFGSSISLEESFSGNDNVQLQQGIREVEDLLSGLIKNIEKHKNSSTYSD